MSLVKKLNAMVNRLNIKDADDRYKDAHELLDIEKFDGYDTFLGVSEKNMDKFSKDYPDLANTVMLLEFGVDPRLDYICKDLGYSYPESQLFFHISKKITFSEKIDKPIEGNGIFDKIGKSFVKAVKDKTLDIAKTDEDREFVNLHYKFYSDIDFHNKTLDDFYSKVIPEYKKSL